MKVLSRLDKINKTKITSGWVEPAKIERLGYDIYMEDLYLFLDDKGFWVDQTSGDMWADMKHFKTEADALKFYLTAVQKEEDDENIIDWANSSENFDDGKFAKMFQKEAKAFAKKLEG